MNFFELLEDAQVFEIVYEIAVATLSRTIKRSTVQKYMVVIKVFLFESAVNNANGYAACNALERYSQ